MSPANLEAWLARREPPLPEAFLPHLLHAAGVSLRAGLRDEEMAQPGGPGEPTSEFPTDTGTDPGPEDLASLGTRVLLQALDRTARGRKGAFLLLSADAFLTFACEEVVGQGDPGGILEETLARVGRALS